MKKRILTTVGVLVVAAAAGLTLQGWGEAATKPKQATVRVMPSFEVDPSWPKVPRNYALGQVSDIRADAHDNIWIIHRVATVKPEDRNRTAPPVLEFSSAGNFIRAWGGPGEGYDWPAAGHSLYIDNKGFVWIAGECRGCNNVLKFTQEGKFVMQIGLAGQDGGILDTKTFAGPKDTAVYPKTNELFVGDTGRHARVMVFDADTGAFKRMWGGFGNPPTEPGPDEHINQPPNGGGRYAGPDVDDGGSPPQLTEAHCLRISNDGLVYVCDGPNKRFQVFTVDGKFVAEKFIGAGKRPRSTATGMLVDRPAHEVEDELYDHHETASMLALSTDPQQRYLYVLDRSREKIIILDRLTLAVLGEFAGGPGRAPGDLYIAHSITVDSQGNVYTSEVNGSGNRRAQKFVFKGMVPVPKQ